ncbi:La protein-like protein [Seiridium cupressi]
MSDQEVKAPEADVQMVGSEEVKSENNVEVKAEAEAEASEAPTTEEKPVEGQASEVQDDTKADDQKPSILNPPQNMLKVKRPEKIQKGKSHSKFDPSNLAETSDPDLIRRQIHFYFSDSNLPTDKFLSDLTGLAENKPVPLKTITSFKRMRRFQPYSAVVAAMKESKEMIVEGEEGEETIRRKKAFDPSRRTKIDERSVYVKGFGEEDQSTQFDVEAFFAQFGETNSVRLRRGDDQGFKGSVFVEWADQETADKFMALDPQPKWKDHDMLILRKLEYMEQKNEKIRNGDGELSGSRHRGRGNFRGRGGRRDGDSDNWKERRDRDQRNGHRDQRGRGRGRGRGNRGRGRDHGGSQRDQDDSKPKIQASGDGRPKIHVSEDKPSEKKDADESKTNGKRAREEDSQSAPPAKKVDTKEPAPEAS